MAKLLSSDDLAGSLTMVTPLTWKGFLCISAGSPTAAGMGGSGGESCETVADGGKSRGMSQAILAGGEAADWQRELQCDVPGVEQREPLLIAVVGVSDC